MINNVSLVGRLTKDIDLRKTQSNLSTCTFTLASQRNYKDNDGNYPSDFIQCVAWRNNAEFLDRYAKKGTMIAVSGSIQTRSYDGQNGKVYITEVLCDNVQIFASSEKKTEQKQESSDQHYTGSIDVAPDDLPFY